VWDPSYPHHGNTIHSQQQQQQEFQHQVEYTQPYDHHGLNIDFSQSHPQSCGNEVDVHPTMQHYAPGLDTLFEPVSYGVGIDITTHNGQTLDYQFNDMVHEYH
jgi:hypothetical protein